ncbi:magnesium/cobalt transporter CorA [Halanaerobacter jeridensis]|uniref:Magnesium transport protein CorA n=1 Tax=Halanaerobacter jeridensis TaxID=706427 RepID=A0A939BP30_9FIRM|nr:magnesium/cobalt transporter CorA [Halanaerobacter jeridensis]MBM7556447.1 magnesium transporter [Halanaerobacter jeridensis]
MGLTSKQLSEKKTTSDFFITYYDRQGYEEEKITEISNLAQKNKVTWINVVGLGSEEKIKELGTEFDLHPLVVEDVLNPAQRPKFEVYDDYILFVVKDFNYYPKNQEIKKEQLSIILGPDFIISLQEQRTNTFDFINKSLAKENSQLRHRGADYLAYRMIDTVVDNYFVVVEELGNFIFNLEEQLIEDSSSEILGELQQLKREIISFHRLVSPLRGLIYSSNFKDNQLFTDETFVYWRDVDDHLSTVLDKIQMFRDIVNGMVDTYLSNVNDNMNQVMQVLTVISTIFIPLSFLTGLYGMNFQYMPELGYQYSYPILLGVMGLIVVTMLVYFKKNNWL